MNDTLRNRVWLAIAMLTISATPALAQFGDFGGFDGGDFGGFGDGDGDGDGDDGVFGLGGFFGGFSFDISTAMARRRLHGLLAGVAFVILFPLGAILLRILPGRLSFWLHVLVQMAAWVLYIAAAVLGFILARDVRFPGVNEWFLLTDGRYNYHAIIGIIVLALMAFQPIFGWLHHRQFQRYGQRTFMSHLHLWNGRAAIILGIVNGGLGLRLAGASDTTKLAYTIVAAVLGGAWIIFALFSEARRTKGRDVFGRDRRQIANAGRFGHKGDVVIVRQSDAPGDNRGQNRWTRHATL